MFIVDQLEQPFAVIPKTGVYVGFEERQLSKNLNQQPDILSPDF